MCRDVGSANRQIRRVTTQIGGCVYTIIKYRSGGNCPGECSGTSGAKSTTGCRVGEYLLTAAAANVSNRSGGTGNRNTTALIVCCDVGCTNRQIRRVTTQVGGCT